MPEKCTLRSRRREFLSREASLERELPLWLLSSRRDSLSLLLLRLIMEANKSDESEALRFGRYLLWLRSRDLAPSLALPIRDLHVLCRSISEEL